MSQLARYSLPFMDPLEGSCRARLSGRLSFRFRDWSSLNTTSSTQCSWFSIPQWARTIWLNRVAGNAWLNR